MDNTNQYKYIYLHKGDKTIKSTDKVISVAIDTKSNDAFIAYTATFCSQLEPMDRFNKTIARIILNDRMGMGDLEFVEKQQDNYKYGDLVRTVVNDMKFRSKVGATNIPGWAKQLLKQI